MATLESSSFSLPKHLADGIWKKAAGGSTVSVLSGAEPMLFGETQLMTFTTRPKAQYVAEGASKSSSAVGFGTKTIKPHKVQVTLRYNEEVKWADQDYQLGALTLLSSEVSLALARALDLGVYHGINPLDGKALSGSPDKVLDTTQKTETTADSKPDIDVEDTVGLVIASNFVPNGIALDPSYGWTLATARYSDGRKKFPDLGFGVNISSFQGLNASTSDTVSAPEATVTGGAYATTNPNVKAIIGDFTQLRWGVQRQVGVEVIEYGDPDGNGDLKAHNQLALRAEVVYGWAIMDTDAFAVIENATADS